MMRLSWPRRAFLWVANLCAIAFLLLPFVPVVLGSLQSERSMQKNVHALLPEEYTLANFRLILSGGRSKGPIFEQVTYLPKSVERFPAAFLNSLLVGLAVTLVTLAAASLSAYALARLRLRWTQALFQVSVVCRMVPLIVLMVPLYVLFRRYGLLNSLSGIVVAEFGLLLPYAVLILVSRPEFMTVPVILAGLVSDYFVFFTLMMAICLLGLLPTLFLVLALQKYVVRGLVTGALKG